VNTFETADLSFAAFLCMRGYRLISAKKGVTGRFSFVFDDPTQTASGMQAQFLALQGLSKLLETVGMIQQSFNPRLRVTGVVVCMHERQTILDELARLAPLLDDLEKNGTWADGEEIDELTEKIAELQAKLA